MSRSLRWPVALCALALWLPPPAAAQHDHDAPASLHIGASAIALLTRADPAIAGRSLTEGYLTQPVITGSAAWRAFQLAVMLNFEGWTLDRGELNAGVSGEGYIDRRHPHTYLHEAVLTVRGATRGWSVSLAAGRGFAPFGTDDPMVRPFVKYPANHHLAQILERWIVTGAIRRGPLIVEAGLFNGDEPTGPGSLGQLDRFGDSWAVRITGLPAAGIELQGSHARVESPEHAMGDGTYARKWSASVRIARQLMGLPTWGLAEWARTDDHVRDRRAFSFVSLLAEAGVTFDEFDIAVRLERTTRAEEERLEDPFRSAAPHSDDNVVGITRWRSVTAHAATRLDAGHLHLRPFLEVARLHATEITGSIFDPAGFYGSAGQWSLSLGVRIGAGMRHARMGRYGAAVPAT